MKEGEVYVELPIVGRVTLEEYDALKAHLESPMKRGILAGRGKQLCDWFDGHYRAAMLVAMGLELLMLFTLVIVEVAQWLTKR